MAASDGLNGRRRTRLALVLAVIVLAVGYLLAGEVRDVDRTPQSRGAHTVERLHDAGISGEEVEFDARVVRMLADDLEGSRHQRFIVELSGGHTVLVSHNIDLADRVPITVGDEVTIHGVYEWNDRGGVVHWTHHDPDGRRHGGWIEFEGTRYR